MRAVLQEDLAHELPAELELWQPLVEAERARGRVADQRPLVERERIAAEMEKRILRLE